MTSADATLAALRRMVLALFVMGAAGTIAELLLAKHTEDGIQWIPIVLLAASLLALTVQGALRHRPGVLGLRAVLVLCIASGGVGTVLHYRAKAEFALERHPDLAGVRLFREAMKGKNPPLLAPGAMIALGLLGLTWTYRHPALTPAGNSDSTGASA